jgi:aspartate racemase
MTPQTIGIVGGAGPIAGVFLLERLLMLARSKYGCYRDADFPKILLLNFPFSDMLSSGKNVTRSQQELKEALNLLRQNGAQVLVIACNTLHAFLGKEEDLSDLVVLPHISLLSDELPLVLCTSTSVQFGIHKSFFPCKYPPPLVQQEIDQIIDAILRGAEESWLIEKLLQILEAQTASTVVLGCTELSIFAKRLAISTKLIIDPLEIAANKVLEQSFIKEKGSL